MSVNPELNLKMIDAGIDRINISIEGVNAEQYFNFSNCLIDFDRLVKNIRHLYEHRQNCEIIIKIPGDGLPEEDKNKFYEIFGEMADGVYIEHVMSCWPEFELKGVVVNREVGIYGQPIKEVQVCPYVFYSFSIRIANQILKKTWTRHLIQHHMPPFQ